MKWQRPILRSQHLAVAVTCVAMVVMLMPLRGGREDMGPRQAGWLPFFHMGGGLVDSLAFHRLEHAPSRHLAGDVPLVRVLAGRNPDVPK